MEKEIVKLESPYDKKTGEVLSESRSDLVLAKKCDNNYLDCRFTGAFSKVSRLRNLKFSKKVFNSAFFDMIKCIGSLTNCVMDANSNYQRPITEKKLFEMLEMGKTYFYMFIAECRRNGYIGIFKSKNVKKYIVNPAYAQYGTKLSVDVFMLFKDDINFLKAISNEGKIQVYERLGINIDEEIAYLERKKIK